MSVPAYKWALSTLNIDVENGQPKPQLLVNFFWLQTNIEKIMTPLNYLAE